MIQQNVNFIKKREISINTKKKKNTLNHQKTDQLKKFSIKFTHQASKSLTRSRLSSPSLSHQTATIFLNREPDQSFIQGNEEG